MAALTLTLDCDPYALLAALDSARRAGAVIDPKDSELFDIDVANSDGTLRLVLLPSQKLLDAIGQGSH